MTNLRHVLLALLVSGGCAAPGAQVRDDNKHLNQTVTELRAERREQMQKLEDLEHELTALRVHDMSNVPGAPSLPVVALAPPPAANAATPSGPNDLAAGQRLVGVTEDGTEIVYEGDAAAGKVATLDDDDAAALGLSSSAPSSPAHASARAHIAAVPASPANSDDTMVAAASGDRVEVMHRVPTAARATRVHVRADQHDVAGERASATGDPAAEYRAAVEQLKAGEHDAAIAALHAFIAHYPHHDYADNAQYWLGEAYYVQKDYARALVEFRATIETYPRGNKVPDALLKVGYCYSAMGQDAKARAVLEQVVNLYPRSEPSVLAAKRLETP